LQTDPLNLDAELLEPADQDCRLTLDCRFPNDLARPIDNAAAEDFKDTSIPA
ncbi:hypothetical protein IMW66_15950, partial [Acinetobacter johnsonii]|nr:hypothetical protein [Acinetobacter johnsonii]